MRFELLGSPLLRRNGAVIEVPQALQRNLLAVMLLNANQALTAHHLISLVWGDDTAPNGTGSLRTLIWSLRGLLAPEERVKREAHGYLLEVQPGELDLDEFRFLAAIGTQALDNGDHDKAVATLTKALRLWVEPPLSDVPRRPAMMATVHKLIEEQRSAREALFVARLALGQHRDLLADLEADTATYPQSERSWEHLMLALYRCGRRAESLEAYQHARAYLADNHGIDPGPVLQALQRQILADDDALTAGDPSHAW